MFKLTLLLIVIINSIIYSIINNKEGYESLTTCIEQGYPKSFCLNVPIQSSLYQ
jgi:hypothetical protein